MRAQHRSTVAERTIHAVWDSRFCLAHAHAPAESARDPAAAPAARLAGLPVLVLLSLHAPPARTGPHSGGDASRADALVGKAHLRLVPGAERRVWLALTGADGAPVIGFSGRPAAVLLSISYVPEGAEPAAGPHPLGVAPPRPPEV